MKKLRYTIMFIALMLFTGHRVDAAEIKGDIHIVSLGQARPYVVNPDGSFSATDYRFMNMNGFNDVTVTITDSSGAVVATTATAPMVDATRGNQTISGMFRVLNLPVGTYKVKLTPPASNSGYAPVPVVDGRNLYGGLVKPNFKAETTMEVDVTIANDSDIIDLSWLLGPIPYRIVSFSKQGNLRNGSETTDANGVRITVRTYYKGAPSAQVYTQNGVKYNVFNGALYNDTLNNYAQIFRKPVLTDEEKAYGWTFQGWRINGSDHIYEAEELENEIIKGNIQLEAIWEAPIHTITFVTEPEKGSLNGSESISIESEGNVATVGEKFPDFPKPEEKEGYKFIGWYLDTITNLVSEDKIKVTIVNKDLVYYAKYEKIATHSVTFLTNNEQGTLEGQTKFTYNGDDKPVSSKINQKENIPVPTAKEGYEFLGWYSDETTNIIDSDTILNTTVDKNIVYYAKYKKLAPVINIGENGNWYIDGVDTGKQAKGDKGDKGDKGTSVSVEKIETDINGNTIVIFSDGSKATLPRGADGIDGLSLTILSTLVQNDGSILVTFSDGTKLTLPKGKDASNLTVTGTSLDDNGNTIIKFSDGSQATIARGNDGKDGKALTVTSTQNDSTGNTIVNFSDGTSVLVSRGNDGKDGKTPQVSIGKNGNWIVDGKDTGISSKDQTVIQKVIEDAKGILPNTSSTEYVSTLILVVVSAIFAFLGYSFGKKKHNKV